MSSIDEKKSVQVVAMESNKAAAVSAAPAQKQSQIAGRAETNNNNVSSSGKGDENSCHESEDLCARASDRNSSQADKEFDRHDKRHQSDESSLALPVDQAEETTTKVKSSSDLGDDGDGDREQQQRASLSAHGDMSAQRASEAAGSGGKNAQVAEDTARDKPRRQPELAASSADEQVEQTPEIERSGREQQQQRRQLEKRTDAAAAADAEADNAGRSRPAAVAGAAAQGQGQGQPLAAAPKQTNSVDQDNAAVTAEISSGQCNGTTTNYSNTSNNDHHHHHHHHHLVEEETTNNSNITKGGEHQHHILELSNPPNKHNLETGTSADQLPYFTTTTTGANNSFNSLYFKSHKQQEQTTTTTTTKRLSYLQALLLRRWPCFALTICIMSSLLFGLLLSAATVLLMHGFTNCNAELAHLSASMSAGDHLPSVLADGAHHNQHVHPHHQHHGAAAAAASLLPTPLGLADSPAATPTEVERRLGADTGQVPPPSPLADDNKQLTNKTSLPRDSSANPTTGHFQRLPSALVPQHYNLFVWPLIAGPSFPFNGSVEIHLTCKYATNNITLHTLELTIPESSIKLSKLPQPLATATTNARGRRQAMPASGAAPRVTKLSQDKQLQYSIIHLDAPLEAGQDYLLRMDFAGKLNDDLAGFYRMNYERQNSSEPTWIAATQFQATDARRAFPCFDEPLYKATFSIKIRHWTNMTALSNMPIVSSEKSQDGLWITDTFAKSQRMSTYLVAWAVTNFESRTAGNITVWTRPGFVHTAQYALEIAGRILRHYEDFFGIAYPLPKMDMIALPDFNAGAMENWGLITYRETAMLYDPETSSVANKQRVAVVVAHEVAHQWFGNLVTPKWWDDLWLNEGFASFVEYLGVDHVEPRWRMLEQFTVEEVQNVFKLDALSSSHQISIPVNNPDEISEIFDHISYAKGASIIRMMRHFITAPVFQLGLQRYLRALKYNNAEQADLWSHLRAAQVELRQAATASSNATGSQMSSVQDEVDVDRVMNSWTLQTGYPLVTLTRRYDNSEPSAQLEQVRYQPYKIVQDANSSGGGGGGNRSTQRPAAAGESRWEIPITYTWKSEQNWEPTTRLWMSQNQTGPVSVASRQLPRDSSEWMILNMQQVGYYRVNYDLQNWRYLIKQLQENHTKIGTTNRAQLLDDLFELARSSLVDYQLAMESTKYLRNERDYLPWESVLLALGTIDEMLQRTPLYGEWQDYFAQVIEPLYARYKDFDWTKSNRTAIDSNDVLEQYNQVNAVSWACQTNNVHCINKARRVFASWRESGKNDIQPSMRYAAYCAAIQYGTKDDWDFLWRVYEREQGAVERDRILRALGCSKEMWILARYLDWIFDKTKPIRRQDGAFVFRMIAKNNYGRDIAFNFMRERWPTIREYYGKTSFTLGHLIKSVASGMNTQVELDQLKRFHESIKNDIGTGKRSFQIAIEEVESNLYWSRKNYKILEKWLQENQKERKLEAPALGA